ncbi:NAD(P)/FAD-dependent oxidoreductase [Acidihalobacter ferrooxydans]|uniref:Pyridine nucleotide-disulfide oxidoreductase n=1 Tax=Acidihalobacter ferrooxydans TaxID=1765967 RepID=A0A1P8UEY4_9GAMM|nr:FAD-dependent oxidoreductase [Acidihalobacter ferrooxydans]APZ42324.1 pyridine nucleotide-disulfide oxidoreductase [Acidihalobacter ferrooxydans]
MTIERTDVLIIGGGPAGMMTGITAAQFWPDKRITVIRPEEDALVPCGIPYIFGTLGGTEEDLAGRAPFLAAGGTLIVDKVASLDLDEHLATLESGRQLAWERLVLATGSTPFVPPIPGRELDGVFTVIKEYDYLDELLTETLPDLKRLVVIGGGFIGVEFSDELRKRDIEVHIVEMQSQLLAASFDSDACSIVEQKLRDNGVFVHTSVTVKQIAADPSGKKVEGVRLGDGRLIETDAVLIAIGARPNVDLARSTDLTLARSGGIWVDGFQRTRQRLDVFAVGDCAHKQDYFTRQASHALLASQAAAEGRIAGMNLYALRLPRANAGTIAVYASQVGDLAFGVAGLTEASARQIGFEVFTGAARLPDHHPATMPGTHEVYCRLIFDANSERLLGGQIIGGPTTGELINIIGVAIQLHATATDLASFQFGSQPRLTAPVHPIVAACGEALRTRTRCAQTPG